MRAYELATQNFGVAEHLLQLHELFRDLREETIIEPLRLAVCKCLSLPEATVLRHAHNNNVVLVAKATVPIPQSLLVPDGIKFLLRQAVVVSCTALESFFWDSLRENVLTIVRVRKRRADDTIRNIKLTLDDYLSLEAYEDPDARLQQIILKNFARATLTDISKIEEISKILTVKNFWQQVAASCGINEGDIKRQLGDLIGRRNQIAHRADRPDPVADAAEECDGHGLRSISYPWVHLRIMTAKSVISAGAEIFKSTISQLEAQLAQEEEQKLAKETLRADKSWDDL